jgi:hypothetical protein
MPVRRPAYSHNIHSVPSETSDALNRLEIAKSVARSILATPAELSPVYGIYGSWGAGKSYLLSQVIGQILQANKDATTGDFQYVVAIFEAWRYELEGDLATGLIESFTNLVFDVEGDKLCLINSDPQKPRLKNENLRAIGVAIRDTLLEVAADLPPTKALATLGKKLVDLKGKQAEQEAEALAALPQVEQTRRIVQQLVDDIIDSVREKNDKRKYRLVMFIDDLDRCSPENMVRLFEWLKNHLNYKNCIYVMALDNEAAANAIIGRYKDYLGHDDDIAYGYRYLEKLVDDEWELEIAPDVEKMAVEELYGNETKSVTLADMARHLMGTDYMGFDYVKALAQLRCLRTPRTMLKVAAKYNRAIQLLTSPTGKELIHAQRINTDYPFWLALMIAMYYRLDPSELDHFSRGDGVVYDAFSGKSDADKDNEKDEKGPVAEFCQYGHRFRAASNLQIPPDDQLRILLAVIRENSLSPTYLPD